MRGAPGCEPLVLDFDDLARQVAVRFVPPTALVTEHLNVDSLLIHELQTRWTENKRAIVANEAREIRILDDLQFLWGGEVAVNVNNLHAALANKRFTTFSSNGLKRYRRADETFQKISAICHVVLLVR